MESSQARLVAMAEREVPRASCLSYLQESPTVVWTRSTAIAGVQHTRVFREHRWPRPSRGTRSRSPPLSRWCAALRELQAETAGTSPVTQAARGPLALTAISHLRTEVLAATDRTGGRGWAETVPMEARERIAAFLRRSREAREAREATEG